MPTKTPARIISFINMKGGVGKTTSSITLAETCAAEFGWRVLVVDIDAQASASYALLGDEAYEAAVEDERTLAVYFDNIAEGKAPERLANYIVQSAPKAEQKHPIDVLCAEPSLRYAERALIERFYRMRLRRVVTASAPEGQTRRIMRDQLAKLRSKYDLIVLDCPPGVSIFAEAGVACSHLVVAPTIPDYLSTLGLKELSLRFLNQLRRDGNLVGKVAILPTKVQETNAIHQKYMQKLEHMAEKQLDGATLLETFIAHSAQIARAVDMSNESVSYKDKYKGVRDELRAYAEEVKELLEDVVSAEAENDSALRTGARNPSLRTDAA